MLYSHRHPFQRPAFLSSAWPAGLRSSDDTTRYGSDSKLQAAVITQSITISIPLRLQLREITSPFGSRCTHGPPPRIALVVAHLSATTLPSCRTLFSSCYLPLHLCALGRGSVIVCSFAISTARCMCPLSGTLDLAPIRSHGATNATRKRGAQTPIILASGIPHGMHGKHI